MGTEPADQRYLLAREKDMWRAEAERTQNRINAVQQAGTGAAIEQTWYDHCIHKHEDLAWQLDMAENAQKYSVSHVEHLDDLDRQT